MSNYPPGVSVVDIDEHFGDHGTDEPDAYGDNYEDDEPDELDYRGLNADDARDIDMHLAAEGWDGR